MVKFVSNKKDGEERFMLEESPKMMCSFYVSDMHLGVMILPYLSEKLKDKNTVYAILNKSISEEINKILSNIQLEEEHKKRILEIDWNKKELYKYSEFEKQAEKLEKQGKNIIFIVKGLKEEIGIMNENIKHYYHKRKELLNQKGIEITIINCYEVMQFNEGIQEILENHDKILNTSGEKEIEDVFEGFHRKNKKIAQ